MAKIELEPLIPLEQFKKLVTAIAKVPKEAVTALDSTRRKKRTGKAGPKSPP